MNVDDRVRRTALLRILEARLRAGARQLTHQQLVAEWRQTGLRASDLDAAIRDATALGCWSRQATPGAAVYPLAGAAIERLLRQPQTVEEMVAAVVARAELFRAMQRCRSPHPGHGRRATDREATIV